MRLKLKTKLVISISAMVVALVATLSYIYVSQMLRLRVREAYQSGDFTAHQIYHGAREALELDLSNARVDPDDAQAVAAAIEDSLQTDPGLNSLLQSIVGSDSLAPFLRLERAVRLEYLAARKKSAPH